MVDFLRRLSGQRSYRNLFMNADPYEKQALFERPAEPVRLTPAWEETNLPNDELNFKGVTMEQADLEINPPKDRLRLVYLTLLLHGVGTLMPWNMFITAKDYFVDYKLGEEYTGIKSDYATNFLGYLGFFAQIPNLIFNWLNIFIQIGGNLTTRIVWSILAEVLVFVITVILAMTDSSGWPGIFFWITMGTVMVLNMANGIYQNTVYGMAAKLPFKYTGAIVLGSNISGTFTAIVSILSQMFVPSARIAAIYYFIAALFVLLACFDTYFALPLNVIMPTMWLRYMVDIFAIWPHGMSTIPVFLQHFYSQHDTIKFTMEIENNKQFPFLNILRFYRYHELVYQKEQLNKRKANRGVSPSIPYWKIFKQCLPQLFNVFFVFFVTLSIFPAVHSDIKQSDEGFFIPVKFYPDITCFLTFNLCAMLGSLMSSWVTWPSKQYLVVGVVLRVLFIPFFLLCKYEPKNIVRVLPILIDNDWIYWSGAAIMGLTSGHFSSLGMMYCPGTVEPQYVATAGMFGAASIITGICSGIIFTMAMPWIVANISIPI